MDETTWLSDAILMYKGSIQQNSLEGFSDEPQNTLDCLNQYTDISNSFIENNGQYNNNTNTNGNIVYNNKHHHRTGVNGLSPISVLESEEYVDLDGLHISSTSSNNNNSSSCNNLMVQHHQYGDTRRCSGNISSMALSRGDNLIHHPHHYHHRHNYMSSDHNHRHHPDFSIGDVAVSQYNNTGHDTSSSSSSISLVSSAQHNNNVSDNSKNNQRHNHLGDASYLLRTHVHSTPIRGDDSKSDYETYVPHFAISYGDQESTSDSELQMLDNRDKEAPYPVRRKPGRPRGSRRKKPEKLGRLWEFIRDLLLNPESCPSLICWDNYEEGMFRFVHSDKVAKLWGAKRDNPDMNYEKLSRAMRYYYKSNVLQPVIGRRLVYKFGPEARGWKTTNPNFTC